MAMARSGAPLPPPIFIGSATIIAPRGGRRSSAVRFSTAGMLRSKSALFAFGGHQIVDADLVIGVSFGLCGRVDDDRGAEEAVERNLVDRLRAAGRGYRFRSV